MPAEAIGGFQGRGGVTPPVGPMGSGCSDNGKARAMEETPRKQSRAGDCLDVGPAREGLRQFSRLCFREDRAGRPDEERRGAKKGRSARNDV